MAISGQRLNNRKSSAFRIALAALLFVGWHGTVLADLDDDVEPPPGKPLEAPKAEEKGTIGGIDDTTILPDGAKSPGAPAIGGKQPKDKTGSGKTTGPGGGAQPQKKRKASTVAGSDENGKLPVTFESEGLRGTRKDGILELKKDVVVAQGDFRMDADQAEVIFDQETEEVDHVVASGNVKIFKTDPRTGEKVKANGDKVTFYARKQTVTILGNARFSRGNDIVRGKTITYDLKSGWLNAEKVDGVVQPAAENKVNP
jgi:lipopolysaccharide transport protein LptA